MGMKRSKCTDLPVSAIPTTSRPSSAGGQVHACTGVGLSNFSNAGLNAAGTLSDSKDKAGVMGVAPWG